MYPKYGRQSATASAPSTTYDFSSALFVLVGVLLALLLAGRIQRYLGAAGIMVVTQIMGLVLASFSVQQMLDGVLDAVGRGTH